MPIWFHSATPCLAQKTCTGEHFVFLSFECLAYCRCGPERFSPDTEKRLNDAVLTFFFFLQVRTVRRIYNFMASDAKSAQEWIDKLQSCLQS